MGTDVFFTGCNVNIRSGSGRTTAAPNGLGNLIVGYNESGVCAAAGPISPCNTAADCGIGGVCILDAGARTGSHNLIVGALNGYSSYGGLVVGLTNTISGPYASVSGGNSNTASGIGASVSGGSGNLASGGAASVSGGTLNVASGNNASVSGGTLNVASFDNASVSGGNSNTASGNSASVSGGRNNTASGTAASESGGNGLIQPAADGWAAGSVEPTNVVVGDFESP